MAIRELTGGLGVDYAFEVIGARGGDPQAFMSLKRGGKVVVVGVPAWGQDVSIPGFALAARGEGASSARSTARPTCTATCSKLIDLYMQKKLKIDELVSRTIKLDDVNAAFAAMEKGEVARCVIAY